MSSPLQPQATTTKPKKSLRVLYADDMRELRQLRLDKVPGVAETLDWATALANLHIEHLDKETVE